MKISFNPCRYQQVRNFGATQVKSKKEEPMLLSPAEKELNNTQKKRLKTSIFSTLAVVIALDILYFAIKNRLKVNKMRILKTVKQEQAKKLSNIIAPDVHFPKAPAP